MASDHHHHRPLILLVLAFLFSSTLAFTIHGNAITCTVDPVIGKGDFTDLQDAMDLCRLPGGGTANITLVINATFAAQGLIFPIDEIQSVTIMGATQNATFGVLQGDSYFVDSLNMWSMNMNLNFSYITFDMNQAQQYLDYQANVSAAQAAYAECMTLVGANSSYTDDQNVTSGEEGYYLNLTVSFNSTDNTTSCVQVNPAPTFARLFEPKLRNNNVTITNCLFANFYGEYVIDQESCTDSTVFYYHNNNFTDYSMTGNAFRLLGVASVDFDTNYYKYAGDNATYFIYIRWTEVTEMPSRFVNQHHWRVANCEQALCDYSIGTPFYDFECDQGSVVIFDRVATAARGNCPITTFNVTDPNTNITYTVTDYELICRIYTEPQCNVVTFQNITTNQLVYYPVGNIILAPVQTTPANPWSSNYFIMPCVPTPGFGNDTASDLNVTFVGMADPYFGITTDNEAQVWSSGLIFDVGQINQTSCVCNATVEGARNPDILRCEYIIDAPQQMFCEEGVDFCCADAEIAADGIVIIYKDQCSLSPNITSPDFVNGTRVSTILGQQYYDCAYEFNCTHLVGGAQVNCTTGRCYLSQCRLGINYTNTHPCYSLLGMDSNATNCNNYLYNSTSNSFYYTYYNSTGNGTVLVSVPVDVTDPLCLFLLDNCTQYYWGNYPAPGLNFIDDLCALFLAQNNMGMYNSCIAGDLSTPYVYNGTTYLANSCNFTLDECIFNVNDTRCFCLVPDLNCTLDACQLGVNYTNGSFCYEHLGLDNSSVNCNDYLYNSTSNSYYYSYYNSTSNKTVNIVVDVTDLVCIWAVNNCSAYYDSVGDLLDGYVYYNGTGNGTVAFSFFNSTLNATVTMIPSACNFSRNECRFVGSAYDPRCQCQPLPPSGEINPHAIEGVILLYPYIVPAPGDIPQFVPYNINLNSLNCTTNLWAQCNCTASYEEPTFQLCLPLDALDCTIQNVTWSQCQTLNLTMCQLVPSNFNETNFYPVQIANNTLYCNATTNKLSCDCTSQFVQAELPPRNGSVTYYFANLPRYMQYFQFIENSACNHDVGLVIQQVDDVDVILNNSIVVPYMFDYLSVLRELYRQISPYVMGLVHDYVYDPLWSPYTLACDNGCPETFIAPPTVDGYECVIDAKSTQNTPGYGTSIFSTVYQAVQAINNNGACSTNKTVLIRYTEQFYDEPQPTDESAAVSDQSVILEFQAPCNGFIFASLEAAVVVGSGYFIDSNVGLIAFVGITFIHPGDTTIPLFNIDSVSGGSVSQIYFHNCNFIGQGAKASSVIDSARVVNFAMRYCTVTNFNFAAVRLLRLQTVAFEYNTLIHCTGNIVTFRFTQGFQMNSNVFLNCRGGANLQGATIVLARAINDDTCSPAAVNGTGNSPGCGDFEGSTDMSDFWTCWYQTVFCPPWIGCGTPTSASGSRLFLNNVNMGCAFTRNFVFGDLSQSYDDDDACFFFSGGSMLPDNFTDNACDKARYGFRHIYMQSVSPSNVPELVNNNPLVQPTLNRAPPTGFVPQGFDFSGISITNIFFLFFDLFSTEDLWACDIGCPQGDCSQACVHDIVNAFMNGTYNCLVNSNWDVEIMPAYGAGIPRYGLYQFRNATQAVLFCWPFQQYRDIYYDVTTGTSMQFIYVTSFNGSRYRLDNITAINDFWLQGNTSRGDWCSIENGFNPVIRGQGHTIEGVRGFSSDLDYQLQQSILGANIWSFGGSDFPNDVRFYRCNFDGRNVDPHGNSYALFFILGDATTINYNQVNPLNNGLPGYTEAHFAMINCTIKNFRFFQDVEVDPITGARQLAQGFPETSGLYLMFGNRAYCNSSVYMEGNNASNIDRSFVEIYYAGNLTFINNSAWNCSGNSRGNSACVYLEGDQYHTAALPNMWLSYWVIENNNITSNRTLQYPTTLSRSNIVYVSSFWIATLADGSTFCFKNNTCWGLPIGVRFLNIKYSNPNGTLISCLTPPNKVFFPDFARSLRALANESQCWVTYPGGYGGINGTMHDWIYSWTTTALEMHGGAIICDDCCPLQEPTNCYIDQYPTNPLFSNANPWFGRFLFNDPCTCLNYCAALTRTCIMLGTDDVFAALAPDPMPYKYYNLSIQCTIAPNLINQVPIVGNQTILYNVSGNPILQGTVGMEIDGCGHWIDNPLHLPVTITGVTFVDTGDCASTWDFTNPNLTTDQVIINGNVLSGNGTTTSLPVNGTFDGTFTWNNNLMTNYSGHGAYFYGKDCNDTTLNLENNLFENFPGDASSVYFFANIYDRGNNYVSCGGLLPGTIYGSLVEMCAYSPNRSHDTLQFVGNSFAGNPGIDCTSGPLQTAFYLINLNTTYDKITITDNSADTEMCVGMRFVNWSPFKCNTPDPDHDIRQWYFDRNNHIQSQTGLDLLVGAATAAGDNAALADLVANPHNLAVRCLYCHAGCFRASWDTMSWWLFWIILVLLLLGLLCCVFCPGCCFCVPSYCYDKGWHYDSFLGIEIPNNRAEWPLLDANTRGERGPGNNMQWSAMNQVTYGQHMDKIRTAQGTSPWSGGYNNGAH